MTLEELKKKLKDEKDETKQADLKRQIKAIEDEDKEDKNKEQTIPYYKFHRLEEKYEKLILQLEGLQTKESEKKESSLKEQGKYKELVLKKDDEIKKLKDQVGQLNKEREKAAVDAVLRKIIVASNTQDTDDLLKLINRDKLDIKKENGEIEINGLEKQIDEIKKNKPWLFKETKNDQKKEGENKQSQTENDSLMSRFRDLNSKGNLTMQEQQEFNKISLELQKKK